MDYLIEDEYDDVAIRKRSKNRFLKVTFPNDKSVCYSSVTMTFIEALRRIGIEKLQTIDFKIASIPLISEKLYPEHKEHQKELVRGWYVMTQSDSIQKLRQLQIISDQLNLDLKVELSDSFEPDKVKLFSKEKKPKSSLLVSFPDGEYIGNINPIDTYKETINKIGVANIVKRKIELSGRPLIANSKLMNGYEEIEPGRWLYIPGTTKEKAKFLKIIGSYMRISLDVTII